MVEFRYGIHVRTNTGDLLSTEAMVIGSADPITIDTARASIVEHIHKDYGQALHGGRLWDLGPGFASHGTSGGAVNVAVNPQQVESVSVWVERVAEHTTPPAGAAGGIQMDRLLDQAA